MASEYYYGTRGRRRGAGATGLVDGILAVVTVCASAVTLLSLTAGWIHPEKAGLLPLLGLVIPLLYISQILLLSYWALRWRRMAFLPLAVLLLGLHGIGGFFRPELRRDYGPVQDDKNAFRVMTYNVMGIMQRGHDGRLHSSLDTIASIIASVQPDILCMQEFQTTDESPKERIDSLLSWMKYSTVHYKLKYSGSQRGWGLAIYSRFPIVDSGSLSYNGTTNSTKWADVKIGTDTVRVFCSHLQTTAISTSDRDFITNMDFVTDSTRNSKLGRIYHKLSSNYAIRASQADSLAPLIASSPHAVIVCGDFNDTPMSYVYRRMKHGLRDGFRQAGHGMQSSYRGFFDMLRIDYILHSPRLQTLRYDTGDFGISDHNPVCATITIRKN